jgi:hypothetical protein
VGELELTSAMARLAELPPDRTRPCCACGERHLPEALEDVTDLGAFLTEACETCAADLAFEAHAGEPACWCEWCTKARASADRERRKAEAMARMGDGAWLEEA